MIPNFDQSGLLPPGIHPCSWSEIETRLGTNPTRIQLLSGLKSAARSLKAAGCILLYLDGSFVTSKASPGDFDGCWSVQGVDADLLDPVLLEFSHGRLQQKIKFLGELFPAELVEGGTGLRWLEFFQIDKVSGVAKGILQIDLTKDIP